MRTIRSIPVKCPDCGEIWDHDLGTKLTLALGDTVTVAAGGVTAICPSCGHKHINTSSFSGAVTERGVEILIEALQPAEATADSYTQLQQVVEQATQEGASQEELADRIRGRVPVFQGLADLMASEKGVAAATWMALVFQIVQAIQGSGAPVTNVYGDDVHGDKTVTINKTVIDKDPLTQAEIRKLVKQVLQGQGIATCLPADDSGQDAQ